MRIVEEIQGKTIIDAAGNEIGRVDDIEVDLEGKTLEAILVKGRGILSKQFSSERLESILKKVKISKTEDLLIPFEEVQAIGKFVVLKKKLEYVAPPTTPTTAAKQCPHCGKSISKEAKYCPYCGQQIPSR